MLAVPLKLRRAAPLNGLHQVPGTNAAFAGVPNGKCRSALRLGSDNHWKFLHPALSYDRFSVLRSVSDRLRHSLCMCFRALTLKRIVTDNIWGVNIFLLCRDNSCSITFLDNLTLVSDNKYDNYAR